MTYAWNDDFAAARNAGLDAVAGGWILMLDADERIARGEFAAVRAAASGAPESRVYLQTTLNYVAGGGHLEWRPVRGAYAAEEAGQTGYFTARRVGLFPARPDLRFSGIVHESVLPAAERLGCEVRELPVPVHHYGHVRSQAVDADRRRRYRDLAERKHADEPADAGGALELASLLLEEGDVERARGLLEGLCRGAAGRRAVNRSRFLLAGLLARDGDDARAEDLLVEACRSDPEFLFPWIERVRLLARQERWSEAFAVLEAATAVLGDREPLLLRERLAAQARTRRLDEALATAQLLVEICPAWQEIHGIRDRLRRLQS